MSALLLYFQNDRLNILFSLQRIKLSEQQIRWIAVLLSLLFSLLVIAQDKVINNDAALYLVAADLISQGEWQAAITHYPWPFLPIFISFTSQVTGLMPEYAAYLLSTLCLTLVVVCFIDFVRQLGGGRGLVLSSPIPCGHANYSADVGRWVGFVGWLLKALPA